MKVNTSLKVLIVRQALRTIS